MRLIDADALKLTFCKECTLYPDNCLEKNGGECDWGSIYHIKYCAPTIDAVPVVRCRECKYYQTGMFCEKWADLHPHAEVYPMVGSDGYCHYGAKMDGGDHDAAD